MTAVGQAPVTEAHVVNAETNQFVMGPGEVRIPTGVYLLIRKGSQVGAVRFTSAQPNSAPGTGTASYESYFPADASGSFRSAASRKQSGEINLKPLKGIGRFAFQTGKDLVKVGDWSFRSTAPGAINMWPYRGSQKDYGFEFAPTSARQVGEIDASDKHLRWFRFDPNSRVNLLVSDLPK